MNEPDSTESAMIAKVMREMGRKGGLKGGKARAASMTPERRREIAAKAAATRWEKVRRKEQLSFIEECCRELVKLGEIEVVQEGVGDIPPLYRTVRPFPS